MLVLRFQSRSCQLVSNTLIFLGSWKKNMRQLLKDHNDVDGIFVNTDLVAIGAITEIVKNEIKVPEDISVVGFSNWFMSSVMSPSLTTINQPGFEMGKKAFKLLYKETKDKKKNKPIIYEDVILDADLIVRNSTRKNVI